MGIVSYATGAAYVRQIIPTLPSHMQLKNWRPHEGTTILAADGSLLSVHAKEKRTFRPLAQIPTRLIHAFISAEDSEYWTHSGIDLRAILRAFVANIKSTNMSRREGGSTITQQVVKNILLTSEQTFDRKLREAMLAIKIDADIGKERVLEIYLNHIYFGSGAYGVDVAAETYFGKRLDELSIAESALIAGMPKSPGTSSPFINPERAKERRSYVLRRMFEEGFISADERRVAEMEPLPQKKSHIENINPAFWYPQEAVRKSLLEELGSDDLYGSGGVVHTTIDPALQLIVHRELRRSIALEDRRSGWRGPLGNLQGVIDWNSSELAPPLGAEDWEVGVVLKVGADAQVATQFGYHSIKGRDLTWATKNKRASDVLKAGDIVLLADLGSGIELVQMPEVQGAVAVLDPRDGSIKAMGGGFSYQISEFNRSVQAKRQTGSVFKPFIYLAALEAGYDPMSPILDSPIVLEQGGGKPDWRPTSGKSGGMGLITLRQSLELSRNMSTVRLLYDMGMPSVIDVADRAGLPIPHGANYSMALGAVEATPMEVARSYAMLANGGQYVLPHLIQEGTAELIQVFDRDDTIMLSSMLEGVVTNGTAKRAFDGFGRPLAAKTGTTNEARDTWFAAYGPEFVIVAWIGRDDHRPLASGASGGSTAAPLVRNILDSASDMNQLTGIMLP